MSTLIHFKERHKKAVVSLQKYATPKFDKLGKQFCCEIVSKNLNISLPTVVNYVAGRVKDGFLTEAMIAEFKKLKNNCADTVSQ